MGELYLHPTTELPDDIKIDQVRLSTRIRNALREAGLKTVGEIRVIRRSASKFPEFRPGVGTLPTSQYWVDTFEG
jgi:hypothetical protein